MALLDCCSGALQKLTKLLGTSLHSSHQLKTNANTICAMMEQGYYLTSLEHQYIVDSCA